MRTAALILLAALAGCKSAPIQPPKIVEVVVEKIVGVPAELTKRTPVYEVKANTVAEAVKAANLRKEGQMQCNLQLEQIEGLTP